MIKNGIIQGDNILGVPFKVDLIPKSNKTSRPGYTMSPQYITIHTTGNNAFGSNAKMHTEYVDSTRKYISWHFTVDDKEIYQELPIIENGWHAGDGVGEGNMQSIGIEICVNKDGDFEKALENAYKLLHYLTNEIKRLKNNIVPHQKWSGKYCPRKILDRKGGFKTFLNDFNKFSDNFIEETINMAQWQVEAREWAILNKVSDGSVPLDNTTRVEVMKMIKNYHENLFMKEIKKIK